MQANAPEPDEGAPPQLTAEQERERKRRQRSRSIAIALILVGLVILFYVVTIIQLGNNIGEAPQ